MLKADFHIVQMCVLLSIWFKISTFGIINTVTCVFSVVLFMLVHFH